MRDEVQIRWRYLEICTIEYNYTPDNEVVENATGARIG